MKIPSVLRLIVAVFFLVTLPVQVHALTPAQVFDKVKDSIVVVKTLDAQGKVKGQGSGVLLPSGKIATNCHVVEGGTSYQVGRGKQFVHATLYAEDGDKDICLLAAKGITGKPAQLGKAAALKVGVPVYAVGAPKGLELSFSDGIVAQLRGGPPPLIQTTAAISPGSSGGGLFDGEGRLVGLTTLYVEGGQSLNFAMPVEWIGEVKPGRKQAAGGRNQTEWLKRATAFEQMKDWQGMLDWCREWKENYPKNASAWFCLGYAYFHDAREFPRRQVRSVTLQTPAALARMTESVEAYRQAVRFAPEWAEAWHSLGIACSLSGRPDESLSAYRQALLIDPKRTGTLNNLALTYAVEENWSLAMKTVKELRILDPEKADKLLYMITEMMKVMNE